MPSCRQHVMGNGQSVETQVNRGIITGHQLKMPMCDFVIHRMGYILGP